jgi:hypothetical protein
MSPPTGCCYPLSVVDQRSLPSDFADAVFVWDIDKTYLATRFSSAKYLARIPIEFAVDKRAIPGMPQVLRGLRRGPGQHFACAPLYFVSASPPQLRRVIERKMLLDAVDYDGITFKDWSATLRQLRPGRLRDHVGFKLAALLDARRRRPLAQEYLFGDDFEKDAQAYSLYARVLAGTLHGAALADELTNARVRDDDIACIQAMRDRLPDRLGTVDRVFIHLERNSAPSDFDPYGPLIAPVRGAFQMSLALFQLDLVDERTVREAAQAIRSTSVFRRLDLDGLLTDAVDRGLITEQRTKQLRVL